ncbi:MAG: DUF4476 domain-containing protein [Bacteroidales bacterium]|nr:DUF4476 domain-containing protein [Bacteroidales bacterium]
MKKLLFFLLISLMTSFVMAQPGSGRPHPNTPNNPGAPQHHNPMPPMKHTVTLTSDHGELFQVYVDGDIVNRQPMNSVVVNDLSPKPHDLYVVLKRPTDKIVMLNYTPSMPSEYLKVLFNPRNRSLEIITPHQHQAGYAPVPEMPRVCTPEEAEKMYQTLKKESFDENRLNMAKFMVPSNRLLAIQIKHLAESFSFDKSKVDFLKFAYDFCVDPNNYYTCLEVLTFAKDKEDVMRHIQSKR